MLLFICKIDVHWYFWFVVKTADNRVKILKYKALKQMHITWITDCGIIRQSGGRRIKYKAVNMI